MRFNVRLIEIYPYRQTFLNILSGLSDRQQRLTTFEIHFSSLLLFHFWLVQG